ncbi:MAG: hypothetical protein IJW05_12065 [Lentisphaeria bacterium]|nr:hypothetical protein [Lentisphaeria bacterium]
MKKSFSWNSNFTYDGFPHYSVFGSFGFGDMIKEFSWDSSDWFGGNWGNSNMNMDVVPSTPVMPEPTIPVIPHPVLPTEPLAPVLTGRLNVRQEADSFKLTWDKAWDINPFTYTLKVKNGDEVVFEKEIGSAENSCTIDLEDLPEMEENKLTFELTASKTITSGGEDRVVTSNVLQSGVVVIDLSAPQVADGSIFADKNYAEANSLEEYNLVLAPIYNGNGILSLSDVDDVFFDETGVKTYVLEVDGKTYTARASWVRDIGDHSVLNFNLTGLSAGAKTGKLYAKDAAGNVSEAVEVHFDVRDTLAPVMMGRLSARLEDESINLSWNKAHDKNDFTYVLKVRNGNEVIYETEVDGSKTSCTIGLDELPEFEGGALSFEIYAQQSVTGADGDQTLVSNKLRSGMIVIDHSAPQAADGAVFANGEYAEENDLTDYNLVMDPFFNGNGRLVLFDVDEVFYDDTGVTSYVLEVDGKTFTSRAAWMSDFGDHSMLSIGLNGLSAGEKTGLLYARDSSGNLSEGVEVHFEVNNSFF